MAKKATPSLDEDLIRVWLKTYKYDKVAIDHIGNSKYRVNLYAASGDIIKSYHIKHSFHLTVEKGEVTNTTK